MNNKSNVGYCQSQIICLSMVFALSTSKNSLHSNLPYVRSSEFSELPMHGINYHLTRI